MNGNENTTGHTSTGSPNGAECQCREARAWREYWTVEAISERLAHEIELYRQICHRRWSDAMNDVRGRHRIEDVPPVHTRPTFAELARRRRGE